MVNMVEGIMTDEQKYFHLPPASMEEVRAAMNKAKDFIDVVGSTATPSGVLVLGEYILFQSGKRL